MFPQTSRRGGPGQAARPGFWAPRAPEDVDKWRLGRARAAGLGEEGGLGAAATRPALSGRSASSAGEGPEGSAGARSGLLPASVRGGRDPRFSLGGCQASWQKGSRQHPSTLNPEQGPGHQSAVSGSKLPGRRWTQGFGGCRREAAPGVGGAGWDGRGQAGGHPREAAGLDRQSHGPSSGCSLMLPRPVFQLSQDCSTRRRHLLAPDPRARGRGRPDERPPAPHWPCRRSCFSWSAWPACTPDIRHLLLLDPPASPSDPQLCPSQFREERNSGCWLAKAPPPEKLQAPREGAAGAEKGHVPGPPCQEPPTPATALAPPNSPPPPRPTCSPPLCAVNSLWCLHVLALWGSLTGEGQGAGPVGKAIRPAQWQGPASGLQIWTLCPVQWPSVC